MAHTNATVQCQRAPAGVGCVGVVSRWQQSWLWRRGGARRCGGPRNSLDMIPFARSSPPAPPAPPPLLSPPAARMSGSCTSDTPLSGRIVPEWDRDRERDRDRDPLPSDVREPAMAPSNVPVMMLDRRLLRTRDRRSPSGMPRMSNALSMVEDWVATGAGGGGWRVCAVAPQSWPGAHLAQFWRMRYVANQAHVRVSSRHPPGGSGSACDVQWKCGTTRTHGWPVGGE